MRQHFFYAQRCTKLSPSTPRKSRIFQFVFLLQSVGDALLQFTHLELRLKLGDFHLMLRIGSRLLCVLPVAFLGRVLQVVCIVDDECTHGICNYQCKHIKKDEMKYCDQADSAQDSTHAYESDQSKKLCKVRYYPKPFERWISALQSKLEHFIHYYITGTRRHLKVISPSQTS